jgi:hypothetical protein
MFVKAGAIVPKQPGMAYVGEKVVDTLTLEIYPGNGSFTLYDDDGRTTNYQNGEQVLTVMQLSQIGKMLKISVSNPSGRFNPGKQFYSLKVRASEKPATVFINGKPAQVHFDEVGVWAMVAAIGDNSGPVEVQVNW